MATILLCGNNMSDYNESMLTNVSSVQLSSHRVTTYTAQALNLVSYKEFPQGLNSAVWKNSSRYDSRPV